VLKENGKREARGAANKEGGPEVEEAAGLEDEVDSSGGALERVTSTTLVDGETGEAGVCSSSVLLPSTVASVCSSALWSPSLSASSSSDSTLPSSASSSSSSSSSSSPSGGGVNGRPSSSSSPENSSESYESPSASGSSPFWDADS
jgi:hypothetical protein